MNLAKRLIRISAVTAAAVLMYEGAVSLDRTTETNASLQADLSEHTQEKAPQTENSTLDKNKETTAESETENAAPDSNSGENTAANKEPSKKDSADNAEKASETPVSHATEKTVDSSSDNHAGSTLRKETEEDITSTPETQTTLETKSDSVSKTKETSSPQGETSSSSRTSSGSEAEPTVKNQEDSASETAKSTKTKASSSDQQEDVSEAEPTEAITGVTPEEESELASEGIRTESPASGSSSSGTKYYLTSQYLLVPSFKNLKQDLNEMLDTYEGSWSVYVKDLKSGISLTINDRPQDSASLIKLYIAGAVLEEIQNQELEETETIDQLLSDMISLSDNEAANELVRYLSDSHDHRDGMEKVNDFIEAHDFTDTHQYNGLEDSSLWYGDEANVTSVKDCGRFLEEVYDGDMVSHLASRQLEGYLLNQDITWKIPAGIPSEIRTANKTGEKDNTQNDVSIVYTPYRDYILCVMATDLTDEDTAVENIRSVSSQVYAFFQDADQVTEETSTESESETEISTSEEDEESSTEDYAEEN